MVEHLSDDDLRTLPRGGHDYRKLYAAYKMAVEHEGSPTVILAKTIKGWTLGAGIESRNATHQIKKLTRRRAQGVPRPSAAADPRLRARRRRPAVLAPGHRLARVRVHDGAAPRARRPGPRARRAQTKTFAAPMPHAPDTGRSPTCSRARARRCRRAPPPRSPRLLRNLLARSRHRHARRADHPRRGAHVRARRAVPRVQDLRAVRPALRAGRRRAAAVVPRGEQRADPRGGDHRGRLDGVVHRRGHVVRDVGPADDPVLHLLFDVRVPARRRPHLGVRRPARPRLPARRHRRAHHARRRRVCSTATARASCWRRRYPNCRGVRPRVRVRDGRDHPRRHRADVRRRARRLLLLPHPLQRELPDAGDARGRRGRHRPRAVPVPRRAGGRERWRQASADPRQRHRDARRARRAADARRRVRRRRRRVERDQLQDAAGGRADGRAVEPAAPDRAGRARRTSPSSCATARARSSRSPTS